MNIFVCPIPFVWELIPIRTRFTIVCKPLNSIKLYPTFCRRSYRLVGLSGLEPPTSRLSGARSNLLSYKPIFPGVIRFLHPRIFLSEKCLVEMMGFEPMTPCLQGRCSPNWATPPLVCLFFSFAMNMKNLIILQNWTTNKTCTSNLVVLGYCIYFELCTNLLVHAGSP